MMADEQRIKAKALTKDAIILLLDMISKQKTITSKATNATNNRLKEEAWKSIPQEFCAITGDIRRPEQLRLKWENLKKAARKRSALIRQNNIKTGGGKDFIPPDEVLDRVSSILGVTCTGLTVEFGGDAEENDTIIIQDAVDIVEFEPLPELPKVAPSSAVMALAGEGSLKAGGGSETIFTPKRFIFNTPNKGLNKRRKLSEEVQRAQRDKDLALAAYFQAKTEKVYVDIKNKELENIKLDLEIKQLKQIVYKE